MSTPPFVRFYANDWFTGCIGLKADERGVYVSMCVYIWTAGRRVPMDDAEAARMMGLQFNNYQRIRNCLIAKGKVKRHDDGYGITRAEKELDHARNRTATGAATGDGRWSDEAAQGGNAKPTPSTDPVRQGTGERTAPHGALLGTHTLAPQGAPTGAPQGTKAGEAEKTQSFLRATKEPESEPEKNSVCVSRASDLPAGFEALGHGALINCETIRHPNFTISIVAVKMDLALQCPGIDARQVCSSAALQWAAEIEGGKFPRDVVPANIRGAIVAGARMGHFRALEHETRTAKASKPAGGRLDFAQARAERGKELIRKLGLERHDA